MSDGELKWRVGVYPLVKVAVGLANETINTWPSAAITLWAKIVHVWGKEGTGVVAVC